MKVMHSEWEGRINHWIRTLKDDFYTPLGEFSWKAMRTMEHISPEEAEKGPLEPVEKGYTWGNLWEYCWFVSDITLPEEAEGKRIVMNLNPGGESTLIVNGQAFGTYRADWVNEPHHYMEDNVLARCAKAGEAYHVVMETYAGHYYPDAGGCATGPVLPGSFEDPAVEGERRVLGSCTYGIWNEDAYQLYMDVMTLSLLLQTIDQTSLRAAKIAKALETFTLIVDFEQSAEARNASYREAREAICPALEAKNGSTMPVFYGVGNAHLDLAWLWPMAETHRKTARTFAQQLRLIDEYPDYKFIQSQPASYEMCRKYYPELFARIQEAVKKGQWIADGAMWVEPDTNMASGEALIRQLLYGKEYYREMFGVNSEVLWLPDTFGYTAALPQILKGCGVNYLVTQKIFWSYNEGDQFPYHYFSWKGLDGSEITSFLPTSYTYRTDPKEINTVWKNRTQVQDLDAFLLPFGYGDGGGGPARDFIEYAERQKDLEGSARIEMISPVDFFKKMDEQGGPANTYVGELYFSAHRGTYTSQAMVKKNNRACELALREMEFWSSLAVAKGMDYDKAEADALWKKLLLHQFHDILPGSSIARVYQEAEAAFHEILEEAAEATKRAMDYLTEAAANAVSVTNSLSFERTELVTLPETFKNGAMTQDGKLVPAAQCGSAVKAVVTIPACSSVTLTPAECTLKNPVRVNTGDLGYTMENDKVKTVINDKAEVVSFVLKESGREFAAEPMNRLHLYKDVPRLFDAWDIDSNYREQEVTAAYDIQIEQEAEGMEGVLKVTGKISNSTYTQYIRLAADSTRLEFETTVDWKELHRLLKTSFPVCVHAENAMNEIQFGYLERPTHRSRLYDKDRFEVCNHRYTALADGSHGAAVLNDSKYGISVNENAMELTLLRAAASPEMHADNRIHQFTYALTAWEGSFAQCDVVKQGYALNVKPQVVPGKVEGLAIGIDKDNIILDTIKPALDNQGDLILRFYECKKAAVTAKISLGLTGYEAYLCDMLEQKKEAAPMQGDTIELCFNDFEIKTIRLSRK